MFRRYAGGLIVAESRTDQEEENATGRIDLRVDPTFKQRLDVQAKRYNMTLSAYIKRGLTKLVEEDEESDPTRR
jgi:predicted HicB family RNase H-like nuclease